MLNDSEMLEALIAICGKANVLTPSDDLAPFLTDWRKDYTGKACAVVMPQNTEQVSQILALANANRRPIVPQGGNTGLCGGATPDATGTAIVLAMGKMNRIRDINPKDSTITVEAGCILSVIQEAAAEHNLLFPLDLAARGSCQIGGNLATNAGGLNVVRYGNARALCLGLEVVLADGKILSLLSPLKKDNTGYDVKNLFIGAEGTLGIITAATLKLFPAHRATATAFVALQDVDAGITLLQHCQQASGGMVIAFELLPKMVIELVHKHNPDLTLPLTPIPQFSALIEIASSAQADATPAADGTMRLNALMEDVLGNALDEGLIIDATIANSEGHRAALWAIRENAPASEVNAGETYKSDISVPLTHIAEFYQKAAEQADAIAEGVRVFGFGHLGDGNLHYNLAIPEAGHSDFASLYPKFDAMFGALLGQYGGSISAEHGIGQKKRDFLKATKDANTVTVMGLIKSALDPNNIMNPDKII